MQRNLGAKSLKHGQLGILFAAAIQVILPLIIVIPGLMALQLYGDQLAGNSDTAFPLLIKNLIPTGLKGFIMAALFGAIVSSLSSMLNAASAIFTMDIYKRHWKQDAAPKSIITIGRLMTVLFGVIGCLIAPQLGNPRFQGFISPGILAAFVFGLIFKRAPAAAGVASLILNIPVYGILLKYFSNIAFLNRMAITFIILLLTMAVITIIKPLDQPKVLPATGDVDIKPSPLVNWLGAAIIAVTVALYIIFW